jgi:hypothetical protein
MASATFCGLLHENEDILLDFSLRTMYTLTGPMYTLTGLGLHYNMAYVA